MENSSTGIGREVTEIQVRVWMINLLSLLIMVIIFSGRHIGTLRIPGLIALVLLLWAARTVFSFA
jgi:hypothetical protein